MTLYKQIGILVSLIIIVMLGAVMVINFHTAKKDMIQNLYETTVNNISTLTTKLAEASEDEAILISTIDAEFDSGYYRLISFKSNDGESDYAQTYEDDTTGVPQWFIDYTDVELESVSADVSSGWDIIGVVSVQGDKGIVYKALYKMFINLSYIFVISVIAAQIILGVLLHYVLKPLWGIQKQAEAIMNNKFVIQEKIPFTTEFQDVVNGMNSMVHKVEEIFYKGNEAVQRNKELMYNDPVTKLFNRRYLMLKLPELIQLENKNEGGLIMFVALSGAEIINQQLGRQKADQFFLSLAHIFDETTKEYENKVIARVNGTEFTLMLPDCKSTSGGNIANTINQKLTQLMTANELPHLKVFINIGMYRYKPNVAIGDLLTRADNALAIAKSKEDDNIHYYEEKDSENSMGKEQWREIIEESIANDDFQLKFWPTLDTKKNKITHKVMTFIIDDGADKKFQYGDFIAPAINLGLVSRMYVTTLKDLFTKAQPELEGTACSVRLSNDFIKEKESFTELSSLFEKHAKDLKFKLSFEVSDTFAIHNFGTMKTFVELFSKYGFSFGINSYTAESNDYTYIQQLDIKFLKADCAFLLDQSSESMNALQMITDSVGIEIIATFVKTQEELEQLKAMHIQSIQGPLTDKLIAEA